MDTRDTIIAGAWVCIQERGLQRASIAEIARQSGVSRGTVYQYFTDKSELVEAVVAGVSAAIFERMGKAMTHGNDLRSQLALAASYVARTRRPLHSGQKQFDEAATAMVLADQSGEMLRISAEFFEPYVEAARVRGEIRRDIDSRAAAEWFARIMISLYTTPSRVLDLDDPDVVARFVADHFSIVEAPTTSVTRTPAPQLFS